MGMLLIALIAIGGFTVLALRRRRALGMLASIGATDENVALVVRANGVVVGAVGALTGMVLGLLLWLAYRPHLEQSAHHLIEVFAVPWLVVGAAAVLALVATYVGASQPAREITKLSVVAALSGRPPAPRRVRRTALPGIAFLVLAFVLLGFSGAVAGNGNAGVPELVLGVVSLVPAIVLLAPSLLAGLGRLGKRMPVAIRIALRDLARYRARSASALAAVSLGVMIAVIVATLADARSNYVWDYAGPNLAANQLIVHTPNSGLRARPSSRALQSMTPTKLKKLRLQASSRLSASQLRPMAKTAHAIATELGVQQVVPLQLTTAGLQNISGSRVFQSPIYVATPQLLSAFGISESTAQADADFLTSLPGLVGASGVEMTWCKVGFVPFPCPALGTLQSPVIERVAALPSGTSAPNTVITERAVKDYGLGARTTAAGWLIETAQPLTATQVHDAQTLAAAAGLSVETKRDEPSSAEIVNWATAFGIALALCILAMSVGLLRSETSGDLRTLAASGASRNTRRTLAAATAGAVGLLGALLGTLAGYIGVIGWLRANSSNGGLSSLVNVPVTSLVEILVGMPFAAVVIAWLLAGREPSALARQPIE
jgi:putative ABC transport system permease protein